MERILAVVPKNVLAFVAIAGGIAFIILSQPPHSLCDSQLAVIQAASQRFLYKEPKQKLRLRDQCKITNNPGGCYEFFQELKTLLHDLGTLTNECGASVGAISEYRRALWEPVEILIRTSWGEAPPTAYSAKFGWLEIADISLFCQLKDRINRFYGETEWSTFRERVMRELPGASNLDRTKVWELSLFSENCARYP
jgi:hypothetical protein